MADNKAIVLDLFQRFGNGDTDGAAALLHPEFVSHNPAVAHDPATGSGKQAFLDFFDGPAGKAIIAAGADIRRTVAEDDLVVIHNRIAQPGRETAAVDIFRVHDELVAEHWDVVQPVPATAANPHGML